MTRCWHISVAFAAGMLLTCLGCPKMRAQDSEFQTLPELDTHIELNDSARIYVQAKDDRDGGDPTQFTLGPSILFYRKPLLSLKRALVFDLDTTKSRPVVVETGYRVITAPDTAVENRLVEAVTFHFPLVSGFLLTDRNRADLDWQNGDFTWRYRNRLNVERTVGIRGYHFAPYVAAEPFYENQYSKWASTDLYAGASFPLGKRAELGAYYEHENDTGKNPNKQKDYVGLRLQLYFSSMRGAKKK
jgi:Protein of unknown function (DUF2490)